MKIMRLESENVKCLKAVTINPDGSLVVVGGRNGAGKSSVLDSIEMALAGASSIPSKPIRRGQKKARVLLDLGDLVVERTFADGSSKVVVKNREGLSYPSPQALLDGLCSHIAFDPLEFSRLKPRDQAEQLRSLVGIDFTALDAERKKAYDDRTGVNRDATRVKATLGAMLHHPDAPKEAVSVKALADELERRESVNRANADKREEMGGHHEAVARGESAVQDAQQLIVRLERELEAAKVACKAAYDQMKSHRELAIACQRECDELRDADPAEVKQQIRDAEAVNTKVRANAARESKILELRGIEAAADSFTEIIGDIDRQKRETLEKAAFPVPGLGFDEDGVTYNELPFDQASSAESLRVSVAMGMARKPKLRVMLIRDASLLDETGWATLAKMAVDEEYQIWLETCQPGAPASVVIVDGEARVPGEEQGEPSPVEVPESALDEVGRAMAARGEGR